MILHTSLYPCLAGQELFRNVTKMFPYQRKKISAIQADIQASLREYRRNPTPVAVLELRIVLWSLPTSISEQHITELNHPTS